MRNGYNASHVAGVAIPSRRCLGSLSSSQPHPANICHSGYLLDPGRHLSLQLLLRAVLNFKVQTNHVQMLFKIQIFDSTGLEWDQSCAFLTSSQVIPVLLLVHGPQLEEVMVWTVMANICNDEACSVSALSSTVAACGHGGLEMWLV